MTGSFLEEPLVSPKCRRSTTKTPQTPATCGTCPYRGRTSRTLWSSINDQAQQLRLIRRRDRMRLVTESTT
jgi:hypothetical protein